MQINQFQMGRRVKITLFAISFVVFYKAQAQKILTYETADKPWMETLGNHRAVIEVAGEYDAVMANIPWRRRDRDAAEKRLVIADSSGDEVKDIFRLAINRENGTFIFRPEYGAGIYYVYYMPWKGKKNNGSFNGDYLTPEPAPDSLWIRRNKLTRPSTKEFQKNMPSATVIKIESRTAFDGFFPMEVIATADEVKALESKQKQALLLFPEDRLHPIRMQHDLPYRWIAQRMKTSFTGTVLRNEYYTFQIGVWSPERDVKRVKIAYGSSPFAITCFNAEGRDSKGKYFSKKIDIAKGDVQPLWFGVDVPENTRAGIYGFNVTISADGVPAKTIGISLQVTNDVIADRGDDEGWRYSRLRWLNSSLGIGDKNIEPYRALGLKSNTISSSTGTITLNQFGLPNSIKANGIELLEEPISFIVETNEGVTHLKMSAVAFAKQRDGIIEWNCKGLNDVLQLQCNGSMESDGYIHYQINVRTLKNMAVEDIRMELSVKKTIALYFMGMGLPGINTPDSYQWKWKGPQDAYWTGNADAGIYCELRGASYSGPLLNLYHPAPPHSWYNNNKGGFNILSDGKAVTNSTYSGPRQLKRNENLTFEFALLITPVKKLNTRDQFTNRYYHNGGSPLPNETDIERGIKIINVHHANAINPYINYPFTTADTIKAVADYYHGKGIKVKLYYTIRELTNQVTELWALRSLGTEILAGGKGGGYMWLREHLRDNYTAQWFTTISGYERSDAALLTAGDSRWYNYYIEGLRWLVQHTGIDGLYLDDVAFSRSMLKRMRRVMNDVKPGCLIDLHSNTGFSKGPANMLQGGGNPWRGMVYGMTSRYPWQTDGVICEPQNIWKAWDAFGIADAEMVGYWNREPLVKTSDPLVLATVYKEKNKLLIAVASWAKDTTRIKLIIDWQKIGWKPRNVTFTAPPIKNFQPAVQWKEGDDITISPKKGWLLLVE